VSDSLSAQQLARIRSKLEQRLADGPDSAAAPLIAAALQRISAGEYGYCVECGDEISAARLASKPEVPRCTDCQALADDDSE